MKKMLNPNTTLWVIDADEVTDIRNIDADDLNTTALNFSCAVTRGYTLNPTDSDTDDTASICDSGNVENRLYDNYEGEITAFRDGDVLDNTSLFNQVFEYFKEPDRRFYIIRRLGKRNTAPAVDGDELEAFLFTNDNLRSVDGGDDGPIQFTIPLLAQGDMTGYFYLGGSAAATVPTISSAAPEGAAEDEVVTVNGSRFANVQSVTVGGAQATGLNVLSGSRLSFEMPAGEAGSAPIVVTTSTGVSQPFPYTRGA